jgi:hypothetical protein
MLVDLKMEFDLDCDDDKEKYAKVNAILTEGDASSAPDFKGALESIKEKIAEIKDEAKAGSPVAKSFKELEEFFEETMTDYDIELD